MASPGLLIAGGLMAVVGLAASLAATWKWRIAWRWLGCGALLWAVAVALKLLLALALNEPVLRILKANVSHPLYLLLGSARIGVLTGATEVAITLAAGLVWPRLCASPDRAIGIGLGAGAFEAVLLGIGTMAVGIATSAGESATAAASATAILTPALERIIALAGHVSMRVMVLYAARTRRWRWFWLAFVFFSAIDGLAGFYYLAGLIKEVNPWWIELSLAALVLISIPPTAFLCRRWPGAPTEQARPSADAPSGTAAVG